MGTKKDRARLDIAEGIETKAALIRIASFFFSLSLIRIVMHIPNYFPVYPGPLALTLSLIISTDFSGDKIEPGRSKNGVNRMVGMSLLMQKCK